MSTKLEKERVFAPLFEPGMAKRDLDGKLHPCAGHSALQTPYL